MFFNNISVSLFIGEQRIQLSVLLRDSMSLREELVYINAPKLKIAAKNRRSIITILKVEAVHIQA
jgi:hypothetical protein